MSGPVHEAWCRIHPLGDLGEWFKPAVLKTADGQPSVSSNLTVSAILPFTGWQPGFTPTFHQGGDMKKDETRKALSVDIDYFRSKAKYYESLQLFEAAQYAGKLASNLELALTTMPSDDDTEIA